MLALALLGGTVHGWSAFFWPIGMGLHYLGRCVHRRRKPDGWLILAAGGGTFFGAVGIVLALLAGRGWDVAGLYELYKWRASTGEAERFSWGEWFSDTWRHGRTNFTLPMLIAAGVGAGWHVVDWVRRVVRDRRLPAPAGAVIPCFSLLLLIPLLQFLTLRGMMKWHQYWQIPAVWIVAACAAAGLFGLLRVVNRLGRRWAGLALATALTGIVIFCARGTGDYYAVREWPLSHVRLFQRLNERIPPDGALMSVNTYITRQHEAKLAHYRPVVGWYLNRRIVPVPIRAGRREGAGPRELVAVPELTIRDIRQMASELDIRYALFPEVAVWPLSGGRRLELPPLLRAMRQRFAVERVPGEDLAHHDKRNQVPLLVFDLQRPRGR